MTSRTLTLVLLAGAACAGTIAPLTAAHAQVINACAGKTGQLRVIAAAAVRARRR